jgi:Cu/Ag efflux pump CusA
MKRKHRLLLLAGFAICLGLGAFALVRIWTTLSDLIPGRPSQADGWPMLTVEAVYPGASAQVVAEALATPIEHQVEGADRLVWMRSRCGNDGTFMLWLRFEPGTDFNVAQAEVQTRVSLALQALPVEVQNQGLAVKKKSPQMIMMVVVLSPDARPGAPGGGRFRPQSRRTG